MPDVRETVQYRLTAAFNEWMRRYTENPEKFEREFQAVNSFLATPTGAVPSYGVEAATYLQSLLDELFPPAA